MFLGLGSMSSPPSKAAEFFDHIMRGRLIPAYQWVLPGEEHHTRDDDPDRYDTALYDGRRIPGHAAFLGPLQKI